MTQRKKGVLTLAMERRRSESGMQKQNRRLRIGEARIFSVKMEIIAADDPVKRQRNAIADQRKQNACSSKTRSLRRTLGILANYKTDRAR